MDLRGKIWICLVHVGFLLDFRRPCWISGPVLDFRGQTWISRACHGSLGSKLDFPGPSWISAVKVGFPRPVLDFRGQSWISGARLGFPMSKLDFLCVRFQMVVVAKRVFLNGLGHTRCTFFEILDFRRSNLDFWWPSWISTVPTWISGGRLGSPRSNLDFRGPSWIFGAKVGFPWPVLHFRGQSWISEARLGFPRSKLDFPGPSWVSAIRSWISMVRF